MITAMCILILASFKDDISSLIDLYSTLQGNLKAYALNYLITATLGSIEFYFFYYIIKQLDKQFWYYMSLMTIVNVIGMFFAVFVLSKKKVIKRWMDKLKPKKKKRKRKKNAIKYDGTYQDVGGKIETLCEGEHK